MTNLKIAVLFDCENVSAKYTDFVLQQLEKYGDILIKRAFRDWSKTSSWTQELLEQYAIEPIQIFTNKNLKNSTDLKMQRNALEIMDFYRHINTIALVSSDNDFRDLAMYIRELGLISIGFGESNAQESLRNAYTKFIPLQETKATELTKELQLSINTLKDIIHKEVQLVLQKAEKSCTTAQTSTETRLIRYIKDTINKEANKDGYCNFSIIPNAIKNLMPNFQPKNFGAGNYRKFIEKFPYDFEFKANGSTLFIRAIP